MVLKRVGSRVVDILVNGTQQESYTQVADQASYDVDVSGEDVTVQMEIYQDRTYTADPPTSRLNLYVDPNEYAGEGYKFLSDSTQFSFDTVQGWLDLSNVSSAAYFDVDNSGDYLGEQVNSGFVGKTDSYDVSDRTLHRVGLREAVTDGFADGDTLKASVLFEGTVSGGVTVNGVTKS